MPVVHPSFCRFCITVGFINDHAEDKRDAEICIVNAHTTRTELRTPSQATMKAVGRICDGMVDQIKHGSSCTRQRNDDTITTRRH